MAPGMKDRLYQQNHCGMYRGEDAGLTWQSIEAGLPSSFGFPAAVHPRDPDTLYLIPLNGDLQNGEGYTDADGIVSWSSLVAGTYNINVVGAPAGYMFGPDSDLSDCLLYTSRCV